MKKSGKKCVLVLGMHRSGTSALAGVLKILGAELGKNLLSPNNDNVLGFFENVKIFNANENVLRILKSSWDDTQDFPNDYLSKKEVQGLKKSIKKILQEEFSNANLIAIKDPRICFFLPIYESVLKEMKIEPIMVVIRRKDTEIAESLKERNGFSLRKSFLLIKKYKKYLESYLIGSEHIDIDYDELLKNPIKTLMPIVKKANIKNKSFVSINKEIINFLSFHLKHHNIENIDYLQKLAIEIDNKENEIFEFKKNIENLVHQKDNLTEDMVKKANEINNLKLNIEGLKKYTEEVSLKLVNITKIEKILFEKERIIETLKSQLDSIQKAELEKERIIETLKLQLDSIHRTMTWKMLIKYQRFVNIIMPPGTKIRRIYDTVIRENQKRINKKNINKRIKINYPPRINISKIKFKEYSNPIVSIIIPVYNQIHYTINCLKSLYANLEENIPLEIIIVNDCSTDDSEKILSLIDGITIIKNDENIGFLKSCNKGMRHSRGKYICFLNNDTEIQKNWLSSAIDTLENDEKVGAVGSKLLFPNGLLQEAGGIVFKDASGANFGRMGNPLAPEYNYEREVDYCSGASLFIRKDALIKAQGFDERYSPAYCEDTDICFTLRNKFFLKVIYQPKSVVIHYEGMSCGRSIDYGVKRYQEINQVKFYEKWKNFLNQHYPNNEKNLFLASRRLLNKKTIMFIESQIPMEDKDSSSLRLLHLTKIFRKLGYNCIIVPDNGFKIEPYTSNFQKNGIEVLYNCNGYGEPIINQIQKRAGFCQLAWICRPELNEKYAVFLKKKYSKIKIIYDMLDLHYRRFRSESELLGRKEDYKWKKMRELEYKMAKNADMVITCIDFEKKILNKDGIKNVFIIPNIHDFSKNNINDFYKRKNILFIGGYKHSPNVDSAKYLANKIMPIVWKKHPDIKLILAGSDPPEEIKELENEQIEVPGYMLDISKLFKESRVFANAVRFGSGVKGKVVQSMEFGLPVVSTSIGVQGMGFNDNEEVLIGDSENEFAEKIIKLYYNDKLWKKISKNFLKKLDYYSTENAIKRVKEMLKQLNAL